ncbi:hypothetical protein O7623_21655 [Solwaraspora sp. WMMD791]|uniref:WXG100 family type VII secretion target n=1 Tax=Solwaraspora sp. WMMD791 TaxID=3016086 RepID=UPI00249B102F|nr:hypothetical protein [Solwaraspora sp. WMMD791]WFE25951.1 hypothetical protein O7623_21655 [Solwaraspora sp. WMMD791]
MSGDYFGWRPMSVPYPSSGNDYVTYDASDPNQRYEPTVWDKETTTIETMWGWIQNESDERVVAVAEMWHRISVLLDSTRNNLQRYATSLADRWQSPAGEYFMQRVGATLYSLDEWKEAADSNRRGLEQLATKIESTQREFRSLWEQYTVEAADPDKGLQWSDTYDWIPGTTGRTRKDVMDDYYERARDIIKPLADMYIDVYLSHITRGTAFKGPTDAAVVDPTLTTPTGGPGLPPGVPPGGAPGAPPTRPDLIRPGAPPAGLDTGPGAPPSAPPPVVPDGLNLAGGTVAPPTAPPPVPTVTPPGAGPAPSPPPAVVPPGVTPPGPRPGTPGVNRPAPPPAGTNRPNTGRPPGPPRPTLPGAGGPPPGNPASRGPAPNRPTLPGSTGPGAGGRPAPPASRPTGRGTPPTAPQLPGSTAGRPAKPTGAGAGRPATPPPSLGGQRPRPAGGSTAGAPRLPSPPAPGAAGKSAPTAPRLSGRAAPASRTGGPKAPGPVLGGQRGAGPAVGGGRARSGRTSEEPQTWAHGDGDDELWETERAGTGTIDAPTERPPQEQGRTLGRQ